MPANIVKSFAKKSGESEERVEELWNKAKKLVKDEYDIPEDSDRFYQLVVGILKKMLKIKTEEPSITTTTAGNVSSPGGQGNFAKNMGMVKRTDPVCKRKKKRKGFLESLGKYIDKE